MITSSDYHTIPSMNRINIFPSMKSIENYHTYIVIMMGNMRGRVSVSVGKNEV